MTDRSNGPIEQAHPNILLITADQWRGDFLGVAAHPFARTPHLDMLAGEGTCFLRHYTQAYPCGPARAGLFTGLYPHKHRSVQNGMPLDARHPTIFTEARRAGYRPLLFGYTDTTLDPRGRPPRDPDIGDCENICPGIVPDTLLTERATPWLSHLKSQGHRISEPDLGRKAIFAESAFGKPTIFSAQDSETVFLTDRFLSWLGVAPSAPFFAHLSYIAPHPPFAAAAPYHDLIDPADITMPIRGKTPGVEAAQHPLACELVGSTPVGEFVPDMTGNSCDAAATVIRRVRAIYAGLAHEVDGHLGRIFRALRECRRWNDTVIIFTADHGEQLFDHWMLGKAGYFDQSAHIPLIIRDPRAVADAGRGRRVMRFTESVDLMPTILSLTGLGVPPNCDGRSLSDFCTDGDPTDWRDEVHWSFDFRNYGAFRAKHASALPADLCNLQVVRTERLKYVHFAGLPPVLFDYGSDTGELFNRAAEPTYQGLRTEGLDRMMTWRLRHEERTLTAFCRP